MPSDAGRPTAETRVVSLFRPGAARATLAR